MNLRRFLRFGVVGVLNTGIYYGCYLLLRLVIPYIVAHICAFAVAIICSYLLNCYITFKTPPRWRTFALFPLSTVANFAITTVGLPVSVHWFGLDEKIAPLPVALTAIPVTYVVTHFVMLGRMRDPDSEETLPDAGDLVESTDHDGRGTDLPGDIPIGSPTDHAGPRQSRS